MLLLIIIRREFTFTLLREALMRTFKSTGTIIWVTFGATALAGAYSIAGGPTYVANLIVGAELPTMGILLTMMVIFLFLGAFMDWVGIVLLVMPVFLPIVLKLPVEEMGLIGVHRTKIRRRLVRHPVLREHAGQLSLAAVRSRGLLLEVGRATAHIATGHIQGLPAIHRYSACWSWPLFCSYRPSRRYSFKKANRLLWRQLPTYRLLESMDLAGFLDFVDRTTGGSVAATESAPALVLAAAQSCRFRTAASCRIPRVSRNPPWPP